MTTPTIALLVSMALPSLTDGSAVELEYTGTLTAAGRGTSDLPVKRFQLHCLYVGGPKNPSLTYVVEEEGGGGWPWPERFGRIALDAKHRPTNKARVRLLYTHQGTKYPLVLQQPIFRFADKLSDAAEWKDGGLRYEVTRRRKVGERRCWEVLAVGRIGRVKTLWAPVDSPIVVKSQQVVFMGRGDRFLLEMELKSARTAAAARLASLQKPLKTLLELKANLQRSENETRPKLTAEQLAVVKAAVKTLEKDARKTPYHPLVLFLKGDLELQSKRVENIASLKSKVVGKPAPEFTLTNLNGKQIEAKDHRGKITVLHFWEYQGEPLEEPYGQVGYLDYLHNRRGKLGVKIYGVAVDSRLSRKTEADKALRSIRKLKKFMNLSYPVTRDDGSLLKKFGDPRRVDAKLPLWIVIDAKGVVRHYKSGFYKIKANEGLRPLDTLLIRLIRESRRK